MDDAQSQISAKKKSENPAVRQEAALEARLERLFREAAQVEVELSRVSGAISGIPHYSVIEGRAHELGKRLSRQIQQQQMNELAVGVQTSCCPTCNTRCQVEHVKRRVKTIDGETKLQELRGHCPRCRRDFFPDAADAGI
jgi:hypothetical protein